MAANKCYHGFIKNDGYTLIEIVSVLVILGMVALITGTRITNRDTAALISAQSALKTHIRHAQSRALQTVNSVWGIRFDTSNNKYWIFTCDKERLCSWDSGQILPPGAEAGWVADDGKTVQISKGGLSLTSIQVGAQRKTVLTLVYNDFGVPFFLGNSAVTFTDPLENTGGLTLLDSDVILVLTDATTSRIVTIASETGFVQ